MEKFSAESVECIINNEETVWEEFKQTMEIWAEKLGEYGIDTKIERYWENNVYAPDEMFTERIEFRAGYEYYCSFVLLKDGKEIDSEKVFLGGEYIFVQIQNQSIFPRLSKKIGGFDKRPLYVTMYTMKEGNIWIEDDLKEIMETVKAGKYYSGMENREED